MKRFLISSLIGLVSLITMPLHAVQSAHARLYSASIRFHRGTDTFDFFMVDLSTLSSGNNGELFPGFFNNTGFSHSSYLIITDTTLEEEMSGGIALDIPPNEDANFNGFPDFFESAQAVSGKTTSGAYNIPTFGSGEVVANWNRPANSRFGSCTMTFKALAFGSDDTFTCTFEILEYTGTLAYTSEADSVSGTLHLEQTGSPETTLAGSISFEKSSGNPFNELALIPGTLTNAAAQTLSYYDDSYFRDANFPTNYYGYFEFADGDPNTGEEDYWLWLLSIDDLNDSDSDGIPDFSDDPVIALPRAPLLSLQLTATNLLLTISGDIGRTHQIQEIDSLASTDWQNTISLTLTNDPQVVELPLPEAGPKFWRVLAQ